MEWIAIDPGGTCGWSLWDYDKRIDRGQYEPLEMLENLDRWMAEGLDMVLYEEYILRQGAAKSMIGSRFETSQIIGVIRWLAYRYGVQVHTQTPPMKEFFSNSRLRQLGMYDKGLEHCRDSVRHALYYQFFRANMRSKEELKNG